MLPLMKRVCLLCDCAILVGFPVPVGRGCLRSAWDGKAQCTATVVSGSNRMQEQRANDVRHELVLRGVAGGDER